MSDEGITLGQVAVARSGDKGDHATLGIVAYRRAGYDFLAEHLTADRLADYFGELGTTGVQRFELPRLWSLTFVLRGALAGGASQSLRIDSQGKLLGTAVLELPLPRPVNLDEMLFQH